MGRHLGSIIHARAEQGSLYLVNIHIYICTDERSPYVLTYNLFPFLSVMSTRTIFVH